MNASYAGWFLGNIGRSFLQSWLAMLVLGLIHDSCDSRIPALGYWTVCLLFGVIRWASDTGQPYKPAAKKSKDVLSVNEARSGVFLKP